MSRAVRSVLVLATLAAPLASQRPVIRFVPSAPVGLPAERLGIPGSAWADVDGDGRTDVGFPARDGFPNVVFRNLEAGFQRIPLAVDSAASTNAAAWGDVDGDGDQDLLVAQARLVLHLAETANGQFAMRRATDAGLLTEGDSLRGGFEALAFGDVDGDGDLDLLAGAWGSGRGHLLLNDGRGRFSRAPLDLSGFRSRIGGVHLADIDGDGRLDLFLTGTARDSTSTDNLIAWNEGSRWTLDQDPAFARQRDGLGSSLADVDGDGDLDLFVAGWEPHVPSALYLNQGGRRFERSPTLFPTRVIGSGFADFDHDGHLDLVTAGGYTSPGRVQVYRGDGTGGFEPVEVPGLTDRTGRYTGLAVVDMDRDGRMDLYLASRNDPPVLFRNVTETRGGWLEVELRPTAGGVGIWGTRVTAEFTSPGGSRLAVASLHQQGGYGGHGEPVAHFAVPEGTRLARITVTWPGGREFTLEPGAGSRRIRLPAPPIG